MAAPGGPTQGATPHRPGHRPFRRPHRGARGPPLTASIYFFDSSALLKRYADEPGAEELPGGRPVAISRLAAFETGAALSRRFRDGRLTATQLDTTFASLSADLERLFIMEITERLLPTVLRLTRRHALRTSDAIHLASCLALQENLGEGVPLVVFDRRLAAAARTEGIEALP